MRFVLRACRESEGMKMDVSVLSREQVLKFFDGWRCSHPGCKDWVEIPEDALVDRLAALQAAVLEKIFKEPVGIVCNFTGFDDSDKNRSIAWLSLPAIGTKLYVIQQEVCDGHIETPPGI